ncbi:MAG: hypothetical protein P1P90_01525 [Patescibacteria group bacterium]|nr:hypothetical protein [Patescibacteria group bacterium]
MTLKRLLRQSRPQTDSGVGDKPAIQMPLTAKSEAMQAFIEHCNHRAQMGYFILIHGQPGDLIEAPALFRHMLGMFNLERPVISASGNERTSIHIAEDVEVDSLFVPCANQIPQGTQEFMSEGHLSHLRLVMLCYPMFKNIDLDKIIRPSLQRKSIGMLRYPEWKMRGDDHVSCILAAANIAEQHYSCRLGINAQNLCGFPEKDWRSTAHMLAAMMDFAKQESRPGQKTGVNIIRM